MVKLIWNLSSSWVQVQDPNPNPTYDVNNGRTAPVTHVLEFYWSVFELVSTSRYASPQHPHPFVLHSLPHQTKTPNFPNFAQTSHSQVATTITHQSLPPMATVLDSLTLPCSSALASTAFSGRRSSVALPQCRGLKIAHSFTSHSIRSARSNARFTQRSATIVCEAQETAAIGSDSVLLFSFTVFFSCWDK